MNTTRQVEVHYIDTGFPYTVTESFMDLFEGLTYAHSDFGLAEALRNQESTYWSMHTNSYKHDLSGPGSTSYHSHAYEINDYMPRTDGGRMVWGNPSPMNSEEPPFILHGSVGANTTTHARPEECIRSHDNASSQVFWQDNIDPDNMTYEELLDLGEAVGTQNRGLSQECISSLPTSKYKCGFLSRKSSRWERCVICQMNYKRGERQMTLPCKHVYHASCVARWLSINKACPVCYIEVSSEEPKP